MREYEGGVSGFLPSGSISWRRVDRILLVGSFGGWCCWREEKGKGNVGGKLKNERGRINIFLDKNQEIREMEVSSRFLGL